MAAILNIAQLQKCSTCPRWHQAHFSLVGCTLPENAKKTSVMSQNEVELKKLTFPMNYEHFGVKSGHTTP